MSDSNEVVLIAEAIALPGKREELLRAFLELVPKALGEAGVNLSACTRIVTSQAISHSMIDTLTEGAVETHFATEHFQGISELLPSWQNTEAEPRSMKP